MEDGEMGLNQVQHVCQKYQILEDQTVAHVLQEQEIHQHLAANKLKTQRLRQNLQVARRLQEEEDERSRRLTPRLRKHPGGEVTGSDDIQHLQGEQDKRHRQPAYREAGSRLGCFASETGQQRDKEGTDFVTVKGAEVSPDPWDRATRRDSSGYSQPRSRKPFVWSEVEEDAGWDGSQRGGMHRSNHAGSGLGLGEAARARTPPIKQPPSERRVISPSPAHGVRADTRAAGPKPPLEMPRLKGSQDAVSGRGRAGQKRECRWDYTEGGGRRESKPTTSRGSSCCRAEEGLRSHPGLVNGADLDLTRRSASDSESHSRRRKRKREELQPRARSEVGHRPVRGGPNGGRPSQPELPFGNHRGTVRHRHRDRGDPGPTGGPQRERRSHLEIGQRANRLHQPLHPTERPNQEEGPNKDGGHHRPLAAEEKKQQAPHPLAVGGQQARQPLAGGQQQAPRPLAVGEGPAHYPLPTKVKVKQVHFLLENEEKMKPAHWPETSKQKQVQPPLELKGKEMCWALTSKQTHVRPPLAAGERGKQPQIPLAPQGRDAQSSLAGRQRKILSGVPLAAQGTLIQYRLGSKDTDTIIDYLTDKRKGKSPAPPPHLRTSPAGFRGARSPELGAGRPAHAGSNHRKLLLSLPPADSREEREPPPGRCAGDGAAWNPGGDWPEPVPARPGGFCWRDEPAPRAAEEGTARKKANGHRRVGAHRDRIQEGAARGKADRRQTPSPLNREERRPHAGEHGDPDGRRNLPNDKPRSRRNGVSVPTWCNDEALKELQAMELRRARLQKALRDEKEAQEAEDEEFALQLLRKEMMALRMSKGREPSGQSQKAADFPDRAKEDWLRSSSPCSLNVDHDEAVKVQKPVYF